MIHDLPSRSNLLSCRHSVALVIDRRRGAYRERFYGDVIGPVNATEHIAICLYPH